MDFIVYQMVQLQIVHDTDRYRVVKGLARAAVVQQWFCRLCRMPAFCNKRRHHIVIVGSRRKQGSQSSSPALWPRSPDEPPTPDRCSFGTARPAGSAQCPAAYRPVRRAYPPAAECGKQRPCCRDGPPFCRPRRSLRLLGNIAANHLVDARATARRSSPG